MEKDAKSGEQVLVEDVEMKKVGEDYLNGKITLDTACSRVPKAKLGLFDAVLMMLLPDDLYHKRRLA